MKVLIVDDEANARENLRLRLKKIDPSINIVGEAESVAEALQYLSKHDIDLIFLDIEMPVENGFQLLVQVKEISFEVIFVTAYNEYALEAFDHLALAYITKPVDNQLLTKAYNKAKSTLPTQDNQTILNQLANVINHVNQSQKIAIPIESGLKMVELESIIFLEADEGYVRFELKDASSIISSKRLSYFEDNLNPQQFIRVHRSFIVNKNYIDYYHKVGFLKLSNEKEIPVSKNFRTELRQLLKGN